MDAYIKKLRDYVSEHKIDFDEDTTEPCLDALWWHYGEYHSLKTGIPGFIRCSELPWHQGQ